MKILLCGPLLANKTHGAEVGIYEALKKLGHEVSVWEFRVGAFVPPEGGLVEQSKDKSLPTVNFDVILCPGPGFTNELRDCKAWKSLKGHRVNWNSEPIRLGNYRGRIGENKDEFDLFLTFDESEIPLYESELGIQAKFLPQAFNPDWYKPLKLPKSQHFPDTLCFIGSMGGKWKHRERMLRRVLGAGVKTHVATIFDAEKVNLAYNTHSAVLNLGLYCDECGPAEDLRGFALQQRIFESVGAGQICITNEIPSDTNQLFEDRKNILFYNKDNLEEVCKIALDPRQRSKMKKKVLEVRDQHTYEARMTQLLALIDQ